MSRLSKQVHSEQPTEILAPTIILCEPQLGENIGTAARAMANFGITELRLVNPRDGWPSEKAKAAASSANHVIDNVQVFESLDETIADLQFVYATTARSREIHKSVRAPDQAAKKLVSYGKQGVKTGILFGRERWGLNNEEISLANEIITFPVDPNFASLNIAQAVLLQSYEWRIKAFGQSLPFITTEEAPATKAELNNLYKHLESALDATNYFRPEEKRPVMEKNLRSILEQAQLGERQVRVLRGVIAALEGRKTGSR